MAISTVRALASPDLAARDKDRLVRVWENIKPNSCPYTYNFHLHTVCSDGQLKPEAVMKQALQVGLQGLAITDHHTVRGYEAAQSWLEEMRMRKPECLFPHLWVGVEITARLLDTNVHILGYAFDPEHPAIAPYLQRVEYKDGEEARAERIICAIHQAGGLAVLAHPERYRQPAKLLIPTAVGLGIDGVETYYAYRKTNPWQSTPAQTETVKKLSDRYGLYNTCGTDSHCSNILLRL
ncbi:PHP domain-containing protein [Oscillatoria sp. FACHB-1406]|uniref:PHP domain-containing protein n=1 Tax=Oscillatoria sp. FACHB-1406 TaxID=2692846 RepID=UPI0016893564|nr:PHP domain-containing protein [Oscillatoria sp. FACHB-1406]MBD2577838.1 PHP domain-containing protein [Oscillatoria sp. FACHB-1406]